MNVWEKNERAMADGLADQNLEQQNIVQPSKDPVRKDAMPKDAKLSSERRSGGNAPITGVEGKEYTYGTRWVVWSVIAAGWISSLVAVIIRGGAAEWFLTAVLSTIIVVSGLAPVIAALGLTAARILPESEVHDGGDVGIRLQLKRSLPIPFVWMTIRDEAVNESAASNFKISFRLVFIPLLKKETTITYTLRKLQRGRHRFEYITVTIGDWLGLTAVHKRVLTGAELLVLPGIPYAELPEEAARRGGKTTQGHHTEMTGAARESRGESARLEIAAAIKAAGMGPDSRPYRDGDSLRHLDWRSAAKGRSLQTKIYAQEQPSRTVIAVDTTASAYDKDDRMFDACVGWASHAVQQAAALGSNVTLLAGQRTALVQAGRAVSSMNEEDQPVHVSDMLQMMAVLRADGKDSMAESLVKGHAPLERGQTILVFTGNWRGGRSWGDLAGFASERGCRLELFIVTTSTIPSFAMREQQKWLESSGVKVTWLHVPAHMSMPPYAEEGGGVHDVG